MNTPSQDTQKMLNVMRKAVEKALERKKRLGQYAVVWQNGKPVLIGKDSSLAPFTPCGGRDGG